VPQFKIIHRYWRGEVACGTGEEVMAVLLSHAGKECQVPLSVSGRLLFEHLGRHRRVFQTARQIADGMMADPFCLRHGANGHPAERQTRRFTRAVVKIYLQRLQRAIGAAFTECGAGWSADEVLTRRSIGNEVGWRLEAAVTWEHAP